MYKSVYYHIIFRTKNSVPAINEENETLLYKYIWGFIKNKKCVLFRIGGMPDHIHIFTEIHPSIAVSDFMRDLKAGSSIFLKQNHNKFPLFECWAKSYGVFTYSEKDKYMIINYIKSQKEHHKSICFSDEYRQILNDNGVDFDEKYFLSE